MTDYIWNINLLRNFEGGTTTSHNLSSQLILNRHIINVFIIYVNTSLKFIRILLLYNSIIIYYLKSINWKF